VATTWPTGCRGRAFTERASVPATPQPMSGDRNRAGVPALLALLRTLGLYLGLEVSSIFSLPPIFGGTGTKRCANIQTFDYSDGLIFPPNPSPVRRPLLPLSLLFSFFS